MQLEFDKQKQQLTIKDEVPTHSNLILVLMAVNIFNMLVQLLTISYHKNEFVYILMLLLMIVSIGAVFFYLLKKSWKKVYLLSDIQGVGVKKAFGRKRIFLKLHNGKTRSFSILKNEEELNNFKKTLTTIGIKSI